MATKQYKEIVEKQTHKDKEKVGAIKSLILTEGKKSQFVDIR